MTVASETQRWIEAAKVLSDDATALVRCPRCLEGPLLVRDIRNKLDPELLERVLTCSACGAMNALRMRRPAT